MTTASEYLTLGALVLNLLTLGIVAWQTYLTRKAVQAAETSMLDTRKTLYLDRLPEADKLIHVMVQLEQWESRIERALKICDDVLKKGELQLLRALATEARKGRHGIVVKPVYEACPPWLKQIYRAGAMHYNSAVEPLIYLWDEKEDQPSYSVTRDLGVHLLGTDNLTERLEGIRELKALLDDLIPEAYLESPASTDISELFDR